MSLGSGSFLDVNTGQDVHASIRGLVPLVGWKMGSELVYFAEGKTIGKSPIPIIYFIGSKSPSRYNLRFFL